MTIFAVFQAHEPQVPGTPPFWPWSPEMLETVWESEMQKWLWPKSLENDRKVPKMMGNTGEIPGPSLIWPDVWLGLPL